VRSTRFLAGHSNDIMSWGDSNVIWVMLSIDFQDFLNTGNFNVLLKLTAFMTQIKNKIYQIVGIVQISNRKIFERAKIDTPKTYIHDHSFPNLVQVLQKCRGEIKCMKTNHYDRIIKCHGKGLEKSLVFNLIWSHSKRCNLIWILSFAFRYILIFEHDIHPNYRL
jgi:hypothetical protein